MGLPGRTAPAAPIGLILALVIASCGGGAQAATRCPTCGAKAAQAGGGELAQARADAFASVARRVYAQEYSGPANGAAFRVISRIPALLDGLTSGDYTAARYALHHQPVRHAVAVRVSRAGRTLVDVGLPFVVGGRVRALHNLSGRSLGQIEVSVQDVIGFVRLVNRETGCVAVVRGSNGRAKSTLNAALHAAIPAQGPVTVAGRPYTVSSFAERGFAGESLQVSILAPS